MSRGHKQRWIGGGLVVLVIGAGVLVLRERRAEQALRLRGADGATQRGLEAARGETPPVWPPHLTEAELAQEVDTSLASWRQAILDKNAEVVQSLDRAFLSSPERYRPRWRTAPAAMRTSGCARFRPASSQAEERRLRPAVRNAARRQEPVREAERGVGARRAGGPG
jgi:hypothetical protein